MCCSLKCWNNIRACEFPFCFSVRLLLVCIAVHSLTILRNHAECWCVVVCTQIQGSGRIFVIFLVHARITPWHYRTSDHASLQPYSFQLIIHWSSYRSMIAPLGPFFIWQLSFITSRRYSAGVLAVSWVGYVNTNDPTGSGNRWLSDKIITVLQLYVNIKLYYDAV